MTREEKILETRRLRRLGLTAPKIGRRIGVSESTVRNWYLGGECEECGAPIDGSSARKSVRCNPCANPVTAPHGSLSRYQGSDYRAGCRCDDCREANRLYMRTLRGKPPPRHGLSGYLNYRCKCEVCRTAHRAYERLHPEWKRRWYFKTKPPCSQCGEPRAGHNNKSGLCRRCWGLSRRKVAA